jgi:hypothetical protein
MGRELKELARKELRELRGTQGTYRIIPVPTSTLSSYKFLFEVPLIPFLG